MASISKRGKNSYEIVVSCGYPNGKRNKSRRTVQLDEGLTERQRQKLLDDMARDFEREVKTGSYLDAGKVTFEEFSQQWLANHADINLRPKTVARYRDLLRRILPAIGHIKLMRLQPTHLIQFYKNLAEDGMRIDYKYTLNQDGYTHLSNVHEIACLSGLNVRTIKGLLKGNKTNAASAMKVSNALNISVNHLFVTVDKGKPLSDKTISEHHKLISSILTKAVYWQVITSNPAERVEPPKVESKESEWYNLKDIDLLLDALEGEPLKYQVMLNIVLYTGIRLGELSVLEWSDIDYGERAIKISKQLQYLSDRGIFEVSGAKTTKGNRSIPIPDELVLLLRKYAEWQTQERLKLGSRWVEHNKLFTKKNGAPIFPNTPSQWFRKFRKRHNLPNLPFHGIRHTFASLLLSERVDVATVSKLLGHADINVTLRRYGHAIQEKARGATETLTRTLSQRKLSLINTNEAEVEKQMPPPAIKVC